MDTITIRKATLDDLCEIEAVYEHARAFMKESGNPNQWKSTYPSKDIIVSDIENGELYVLYSDCIEGAFVFTEGEDPTYSKIDGKWLNDLPHRAIHRVASLGRVRGMVALIADYCFSFCQNIKIDTHEDNIVMQKVLCRYGFTPCGTVYLKNGESRIAYQMKK